MEGTSLTALLQKEVDVFSPITLIDPGVESDHYLFTLDPLLPVCAVLKIFTEVVYRNPPNIIYLVQLSDVYSIEGEE